MAVARCAGWFIFTAALLSALLLAGCGGGSNRRSELMSGTVAVGEPLAGATVRMRCADGSEYTTTSTGVGTWQIVVTTHLLPCALQASGGSAHGLPNATSYHSVALAFGVTNITPLTDLVTARLLGADPQTWFARPDFARVNARNVQTALLNVSTGLGLSATLGQLNPLTEPFGADAFAYVLDRVLDAMRSALLDARVNKAYAELRDAAITGDLDARFAAFGAAFDTAYAAQKLE
jgi:hypothetical protein